jgi:non-heme chloroperoxidase
MENKRWSLLNGDVQLCGRQRGAGKLTLVFAHGWISSRRMWHSVVGALPLDIASLDFDFRGCGESDRPMAGHDLEGYASDLRAVTASIEGPVVIVAHSMGARIAQYLALEQPSNVRGYFLLAPGVARGTIAAPRHREMTERAYGSRRRIQAFQHGAMRKPIAADDVEQIIEDALIAQREHWFGWYDAGRTVDFSHRIHEIRVPVCVVAGEEDPLIPIGRIQREIIDHISGAEMHVIPGAGHNLAVEAVQEVSERLAHFLLNPRINI